MTTFSDDDLSGAVEDSIRAGATRAFLDAGVERDGNSIWVYLSNGQRIRIDVVLESEG